MQLIVLGMHRSGTSSVTRLLNLAGAYFGPEGSATDPNAENPKGFWERRDVRAVCDGLLQAGGFDWWKLAGFAPDDIAAEVRDRYVGDFRRIVFDLDAHRPWVMKEPRLCVLLPILRDTLEAPVFVHVAREPLEIAHSLMARNGIPIAAGLALWEYYTVSAYSASADDPAVFVSYADLVGDPVATTTSLVEQLQAVGVDGLHVPTEREISAFVEPGLRRQRQGQRDRAEYLNARQIALARVGDKLRPPTRAERARVSAGALSVLKAFEEREELTLTVADLEKQVVDTRTDLEATHRAIELSIRAQAGQAMEELERRHEGITGELKAGLAEGRRAEDKAIRSLASATRRVKAVRRSRIARIAVRASLLQAKVGRRSPSGIDAAVSAALGDIAEARSALTENTTHVESLLGTGGEDGPSVEQLQLRRRLARARGGRTKVAVLAWDVGHNPFGRAHLLADMISSQFDVELWGPQFERYGKNIWRPMRGTKIPVRRFAGLPFPEFMSEVDNVAAEIDADAIWVSKPRFPSLGVGILAKQLWNRPLVVDIDDFEPSFFAETTGLDPHELLARRGDDDLALPFGRSWTRACEFVVGAAEQITVSNRELEERYGGVVVPHARNESVFDPERFDRRAERHRLGLRDTDRLIVFGGTPRVHKGIVELLEAVDALHDDRIRVGVFGTRELETLRDEIGSRAKWILPLPRPSFDDLPATLVAADLACALQSPSHPVSRYQMPAKVTDAMAMGVPCLVTPVPPLQPLIDKDVVEVFDGDAPLAEQLRDFFSRPDEARDRARRGRDLFVEAYSYEAVRPIAIAAIEQHLEDPAPVAAPLSRLVSVARALADPQATPELVATRPSPVERRAMPPGSTYDLVVLWKQNDTGIYGRRQDMFVKYLEQSGRFRTIVHFDQPMSAEGLLKTVRNGFRSDDQNRLVARQTLRRVVKHAGKAVREYTFVYAAGRWSRRLKLPAKSDYPAYVRRVLAASGIGERPLVCWVYPTSSVLPEVLDAITPDVVVADVVDDNRSWYEPGAPGYVSADRNYREVLARSDIVLANCTPVAQDMRVYADQIHVIPNACEMPPAGPVGPRPRELRDLKGPIIGYAGNLSGRIDLELLRGLIRSRADWNFVFVGSTHFDKSVLELQSAPNVRFIGAKRYDEAQRIIRHFDVALIPHLDNVMSRSMNPLKAFVYASLGVPIVTTPVANLDELAGFFAVADGLDQFIDAIDAALRSGRTDTDPELLAPHSWPVRVARVLELIDDEVARRREPATEAAGS